MKELLTNIIFWVLGIVLLTIELVFKFNDLVGWLLATVGVLLIGVGFIYKSKKPLGILFEFFINFF